MPRAGPGSRPFWERWPSFFLSTGWAWLVVLFDLLDPGDRDVGGWVALSVVILGTPWFLWMRHRGTRCLTSTQRASG